MADLVFNIAKGRVAELYNRVKTNDPAASGLIIVPIDAGATTDATLRDCATLAAVLAVVTERSTSGWARKTLTDADLAALAVDNANDRMPVDIPDQTWTGPSAGAVTDLVICYKPDTATSADSAIIPLTMHDFPITPDGTDVTVNVTDFYRAS